MTLWDSIRKILRSEGADLKEGLDGAKDKLDGFLTEKERERAATPKERMDMISDDIATTESEFDRILEKAEGRGHEQTAESELREALGGTAKPTTPTAAAADTPDAAESAPSAAEDSATKDTAAQAAAEQAAAAKAAAEQAAAERAAEEEARRLAARKAADAKFEEQKAKAGDLLDELRDELGLDDGDPA